MKSGSPKAVQKGKDEFELVFICKPHTGLQQSLSCVLPCLFNSNRSHLSIDHAPFRFFPTLLSMRYVAKLKLVYLAYSQSYTYDVAVSSHSCSANAMHIMQSNDVPASTQQNGSKLLYTSVEQVVRPNPAR